MEEPEFGSGAQSSNSTGRAGKGQLRNTLQGTEGRKLNFRSQGLLFPVSASASLKGRQGQGRQGKEGWLRKQIQNRSISIYYAITWLGRESLFSSQASLQHRKWSGYLTEARIDQSTVLNTHLRPRSKPIFPLVIGLGVREKNGNKTHSNRPKNALINNIVWYKPVRKYGFERDQRTRKKGKRRN